MNSNGWTWSDLSGEKLGMLNEAEQTLGADILLAFQEDKRAEPQRASISQSGLHIAPLNESQLECLQGLEEKMQAVVIAYQQTSA